MPRKSTSPSERSLSNIIRRAETLAKQIPALQQELDELVVEYEKRMADAQALVDTRVAGLKRLTERPSTPAADGTEAT